MTDPMPQFIIKGKDFLAARAVAAYMNLCFEYGQQSQAGQVAKALAEIVEWQERNPEVVQMPDHEHVPVAPESDPLDTYYGPTEWDSDPGKLWHRDCGGEVLSFRDGQICGKCERVGQ